MFLFAAVLIYGKRKTKNCPLVHIKCGTCVFLPEIKLNNIQKSNMSWQDYVDNQLMASQCVTKACIAGHDGNIWASSKGFEVSVVTIVSNKFMGVTPA